MRAAILVLIGSILLILPDTGLTRTWYITPDGTGDAPTIQAGIDSAAAGDTVLVAPGEFHENLVVDKPELRLFGSGADSVTVLYPALSDVGPAGPPVFGNSQVIVVAATDVVIQGLMIDGDSPALTPEGTLDARNGIILDHTTGDWGGCLVQDLIIYNLYMSGVYFRGATHAGGNQVTGTIISHVNSVPDWSTGIALYNAAGTVDHNSVTDCERGSAFLSGSGGHVYTNVLGDNTIGILVRGNGSTVEVGANNNVINYETAGIQVDRAAAPVDIHHNLTATMLAPTEGGSTGIGIIGQAAVWAGRIEIVANTISGPASARSSYGIGVDTYPASAREVHVDIVDNTIHFFDIGIYLVDSSADPSGVHDVIIGGDSLSYNNLSSHRRYSLMLDACDDPIDARWNDWGKYTPGEIEQLIYHQVDDPSLGLVSFQPFRGGGYAAEPATWGLLKGLFRQPGR